MQKKVMYLFLIRGKIGGVHDGEWKNLKSVFQLICMNTGEKNGSDKCLTVINNELTIQNLNDCDNVGVGKKKC